MRRATEPATGPASGVEAGDPPATHADAPDAITAPDLPQPDEAQETPAGPRYEHGWTEELPRQSITGEVPIRRRESR